MFGVPNAKYLAFGTPDENAFTIEENLVDNQVKRANRHKLELI